MGLGIYQVTKLHLQQSTLAVAKILESIYASSFIDFLKKQFEEKCTNNKYTWLSFKITALPSSLPKMKTSTHIAAN